MILTGMILNALQTIKAANTDDLLICSDYITAKGDNFTIATPCKIFDEPVAVEVDAKEFNNAVGMFDKKEVIDASVIDGNIVLSNHDTKLKVSFKSVDGAELTIAEVADATPITKEAIGAIGAALLNCAKNDIRYYLNGVALYTEENSVTAVASTDGHRLYLADFSQTQAYKGKQPIVVMPYDVAKFIVNNKDGWVMGGNKNKFNCVADDGTCIEFENKCHDSKYPDVARVIKTCITPQDNAVIDVKATLQIANKFAKYYKSIKSKFGGVVIINNNKIASEEEKLTVATNMNWDSHKHVALNHKYFLDAVIQLDMLGYTEAVFNVDVDSNTSVLFMAGVHTMVVMPTRYH